MRVYSIAVLPGDGIGPEVTTWSCNALQAIHESGLCQFDLQIIPCAGSYYVEHQKEWPDGSFERCRDADAILLGAIGHLGADGKPVRRADGELAGYEQVIGLRTKLDLYANMRPIKLYPGILHSISGRFRQVWDPKDVDLLVFRENTEGAYVPGEFRLERGGQVETVISPTMITRHGAARVAREAFRRALRRNGAPADGIRRVTCVDKSNVVRAHRFFREVFQEVAAEFPGVEASFAYVDAFAYSLISRPESYDVVVAPNLPGDIVTDLGSVMQGGMGMAASGNLGDRHAMFEPIHGSAPDIAGQNKANPVASLLSTAMMLEWLSARHGDESLSLAARCLDDAICDSLGLGEALTPDLGGSATTADVGTLVVDALRTQLDAA